VPPLATTLITCMLIGLHVYFVIFLCFVILVVQHVDVLAKCSATKVTFSDICCFRCALSTITLIYNMFSHFLIFTFCICMFVSHVTDTNKYNTIQYNTISVYSYVRFAMFCVF